MNQQLLKELSQHETDIEEAINRFSGNKDLYQICLMDFVQDTTMLTFENAVKRDAWDEAFTAVHALKGLAGNMGFIPLFHTSAKIVILLREGRLHELPEAHTQLKQEYDEIVSVINRHFPVENGGQE